MDRAGFSPEKVKPPVESMSPGDMLKSGHFSDFLAVHLDAAFLDADGHPDYDDDSTIEEMRKLYRAYDMHKEVAKDLKKFFGDESKKDVGKKREKSAEGKPISVDGIDALEDRLFEDVDLQGHLADMAGSDPDLVKEIADKAKEFYRLQQTVGAREEELQAETAAVQMMTPVERQQMQKNAEIYRQTKDQWYNKWFKRWRGPVGKLARSKEENEMVQSLKQDFNVKLNEAEDVLGKFELGDSVLRLRELKNYFFTEFEPGKALLEQIKLRVQRKLDELMDLSSTNNEDEALAQADTASRLLKSLKKVEEKTGISYVDTTVQSLDSREREIDEFVETRLEYAIGDAVHKFEHTRSNDSMDAVEKALKKFVTRNEVGTKEGDDAREFVRDTLQSIINSLPNRSGKRFVLGYWLKHTFA